MPSRSLFDEFSVADHIAAFDAWLATQQASGRLRQASSVQVYRDMWGSFTAWSAMQDPPVSLELLGMRDLASFQDSRSGMGADLSLSPRHTRRLFGLIDRVLRHHAAQDELRLNTAAKDAITAQPAVRFADAASKQLLPQALGAAEAKGLITFLTRARPRLGASAQALTWQQLRNRVAVSLQLGAGLAPGDIRLVRLDAPTSSGGRVKDRPWKIRVPGNGNSPERETPIAPWAGELLQYWLEVRAEQQIAGDWLFPSTRGGKPWGKVAQYTAAKQVFADAGLDDVEGGSFRLRHTFALRQLKRGTDPEQVARWLGVTDPAGMARYRRLLSSPVDVV